VSLDFGKLRHRVTIESSTVTRDEYGGEVITWAEVFTTWAAVEPLSGREFLDGRRQESEINTRIRLRYRSGLVPGMRVTWGAHVYDIESVIERESRRREIWLMCQELGLDR
jgi:SPP1 family predicted phage head-tail adaptor